MLPREYVPEAQFEGVAEGVAQYLPAGQGVYVTELAGQLVPGGHRTGA